MIENAKKKAGPAVDEVKKRTKPATDAVKKTAGKAADKVAEVTAKSEFFIQYRLVPRRRSDKADQNGIGGVEE